MNIMVNCPHCGNLILILENEIKNKKFIHNLYKKNNLTNLQFLKNKCDVSYFKKLMYGCGEPYEIINEEKVYKALKCDF